jgi:DNA polymerase III delta prime subunit
MEQINFNQILNRESCVQKIKKALDDFQSNKTDTLQKRGIYIYGAPGTGKTLFTINVLEELGYDIIKYDAGDIRNKSIIENITLQNMSDRNVLSMFTSKVKPIAILMDEIDGMNNGDKGGINALIKLIRPKKTKKQKLEDSTCNPIVCIGNYHMDKKIKELMKVCTSVELKPPTDVEMTQLIKASMPIINTSFISNIKEYINNDLRKFSALLDLYKENNIKFNDQIISKVFKKKSYNEDTKQITKRIINNKITMENHIHTINETDRTIVGLLWHENIVDPLSKLPPEKAFPFYQKALNLICFADYIDRITFQKQIWQFNEISSLIKTFHTNKLYHETFTKKPKYNPTDIRFTKVLTKYSTEYNNNTFIQNICQQLSMDKKDVFSYFLELRNSYSDDEIYEVFQTYDICKLDINRIYRYIDKYTKNPIHIDIDIDEDDDM